MSEVDWPIRQATDHGTHEAIYLHDPDGNGIELYRDRPQDEWPRNPDGTFTMVDLGAIGRLAR